MSSLSPTITVEDTPSPRIKVEDMDMSVPRIKVEDMDTSVPTIKVEDTPSARIKVESDPSRIKDMNTAVPRGGVKRTRPPIRLKNPSQRKNRYFSSFSLLFLFWQARDEPGCVNLCVIGVIKRSIYRGT